MLKICSPNFSLILKNFNTHKNIEVWHQSFEAISKILIEFTAKKAASTPEQHADPIRMIMISKINKSEEESKFH